MGETGVLDLLWPLVLVLEAPFPAHAGYAWEPEFVFFVIIHQLIIVSIDVTAPRTSQLVLPKAEEAYVGCGLGSGEWKLVLSDGGVWVCRAEDTGGVLGLEPDPMDLYLISATVACLFI